MPIPLRNILTPLNLAFWQEELQSHQDKEFTKLILKGLSSGFRIGFNPQHLPMGTLQPARRNMLSALEHLKVVDEYLTRELLASHFAIASQTSTWHLQIQTSPSGVIPKKGKVDQWRLEVYRYIGSAKYRLPIWQNFQYRQSVFFEIVPIFLPIFYTSTNWLIILMHCLVVTIFYCVHNHFTSCC